MSKNGCCDICGREFNSGERVLQIVEDKFPTFDKEVVLVTAHHNCIIEDIKDVDSFQLINCIRES